MCRSFLQTRLHFSLTLLALSWAVGMAGCGDNAPPCPSSMLTCSGGLCVDSLHDPANCGGCGAACAAGEVCTDGECAVACPISQSECDGGCFDLTASSDHCGACGNACARGEVCSDGQCMVECPAGQDDCGGGCFDLQSSTANCGACGTTCAEGEACVAGQCTVACPAGQDVCNGGCFDLQTSDEHCGTCDNACADNARCIDGACEVVCPGGLSDCDGVCVNSNHDPNNCGACGVVCGDSETCIDGQCVFGCPSWQTECSGSCYDLQTSLEHCGACGNACGANEFCAAGTCTSVCPLTLCDLACVDLDTNPGNCGACGNECPTGPNASPVCVTGGCDYVCNAGFVDCDRDLTNGCETVGTKCEELTCDDGMDNDSDGRIDCHDSDCLGNPACIACPNGDLGQAVGNAVATSLIMGRLDEYPSSPTCGELTTSGEDKTLLWQAPGDGCYEFDTDDSNFDTVLRIFDTCDGGVELQCDDDSGVEFKSRLRREMVAGEQVVLVVDGYSNQDEGTYVLDINYIGTTCAELVCDDGTDDDRDGFADCDDSDCDLDPACSETICDDGVDDEGDGLVDCSDPDCAASPLCKELVCDDGLDSDSDGNIDCADADCAQAPNCFESNCTDGADNDSDGAIDCADSDCAQDAACVETVCDDNGDNDGDGYADCLDTDCFGDAACAGQCPNRVLGIATGDRLVAGLNAGSGDDFTSTTGCGDASTSGHDVAFDWVADLGGCYVFDTDDSNYDTVLRLYDNCGAGTLIECDDDDGVSNRSLIKREIAAGTQLTVVVDGYRDTSLGTYVLDINRLGSSCTEVSCHDTIDDDGDGAIDCLDTDCAADSLCTETVCNDGLDDDGDGNTDCADADCAADPACKEIDCTDMLDSDNDGATDCADTDCYTDAACVGLCPTADLGMATGNGLAQGASAGTGNDFPSTTGCGSSSSSGADVAFTWQAPAAGCYEFDTDDSSYNTVLRLFNSCADQTLIECDDNDGAGTRSLIRRNVAQNDQFLVVVDGYSGTIAGNYSLDINLVAPVCAETSCTDGLDEDNDGAIDCADSDCATGPDCLESACSDGLDSDNDGAIDCADPDCFADVTCQGQCPNTDLGMATGDGLIRGKNAGAGDGFPSTTGCGSTSSSGNDVAFTWQAPADGCYVFDTESASYSTVLRLYDTCQGNELQCDYNSGASNRSRLERQVTANEQFLVVVDGYSSSSSGTYVLDINRVRDQCVEVSCTDGLDEDTDGAIDCADADCNQDPACHEQVCDDGLDSDNDGLIDCADIDCVTSMACQGVCPNADLGSVLGTKLVPGRNESAGNDFSSTTGCGSSSSSGEDVAFAWRAPVDGCYTVSTDTSSYDTVLRIFDSCAGNLIECDDDDGEGTRSLIKRQFLGGQDTVLVVDGYSSSSKGNYVLNITRGASWCTEVKCSNGVDDDGDGQIDCADSNCNGDPRCP